MSTYEDWDHERQILMKVALSMKGLLHQRETYDPVTYGILAKYAIPKEFIKEYAINKLRKQIAIIDQMDISYEAKYNLGIECIKQFYISIISCFVKDPEVITDFMEGIISDEEKLKEEDRRKLIM